MRPNTLAPALARLGGSTEFSLEGYRQQLGIPQLVRARSSPKSHLHAWLIMPHALHRDRLGFLLQCSCSQLCWACVARIGAILCGSIPCHTLRQLSLPAAMGQIEDPLHGSRGQQRGLLRHCI